jgi:Fe-S oxidoreductase
MAKMKAEFLQQYYDAKGISFRTRMVGNFNKASNLAAIAPGAYNFFFKNSLTSAVAKQVMGFAPKRSVPLLYKTTLRSWYKKHAAKGKGHGVKGKVYLFCDEFTNFNDTEIGIKAIELLEKLGYEVMMPDHEESGRTYISKGLLRDAKKIAIQNVQMLKGLITPQTPIIGIEPSAILTLRDEYLDLVGEDLLPDAVKIAGNALLIDEFIAREIDKGNITKEAFTQEKKLIKLHGHCHQKALSSLTHTKKMLSLPENYTMHLIPSGCCGMAGSFGYEKEHYEVSMQIGELVLFPTVRKQPAEVIIAAPGTSCRHQIKDGTGRQALHPVEILWQALKKCERAND